LPGKVQTSGKGHTAVHHQQLAVTAIICIQRVTPFHGVDVVIFNKLDAAALHALEERGPARATTDTVVYDAHRHAGSRLSQQRFRETPADFVVGKNVGFEMDEHPSCFDGFASPRRLRDHRSAGRPDCLCKAERS
jgi:hypothetical protein